MRTVYKCGILFFATLVALKASYMLFKADRSSRTARFNQLNLESRKGTMFYHREKRDNSIMHVPSNSNSSDWFEEIFDAASAGVSSELEHDQEKPDTSHFVYANATPSFINFTATQVTVKVGAVFDSKRFYEMSSLFLSLVQQYNNGSFFGDVTSNLTLQRPSYNQIVHIEGIVFQKPTFNEASLREVCSFMKREAVNVGLSYDFSGYNYATLALSSFAGTPIIIGTSNGYRNTDVQVLFPHAIDSNPSVMHLWTAASTVASAFHLYQPVLVHDDSLRSRSLADIAVTSDLKPHLLSLTLNFPQDVLCRRLSGLFHNNYRLLMLSGSPPFVLRILELASKSRMFSGEFIWLILDSDLPHLASQNLPLVPGLLKLEAKFDSTNGAESFMKTSLSVIGKTVLQHGFEDVATLASALPCQVPSLQTFKNVSTWSRNFENNLDSQLRFLFNLQNLVPQEDGLNWTTVGWLEGDDIHLQSIYWPGRGFVGVVPSVKLMKVAFAEAPPFIMTSELIENATCLVGVTCLKMFSRFVDETFNDFDDGVINPSRKYEVLCCFGISIDLMLNMAEDLDMEMQAYLVEDGSFGALKYSGWTGIIGDIQRGAAQLTFAPLSVTSQRDRVVDFSDPFLFSSMSILSSSRQIQVPLLAFLVPFSADLWIAIFVSLNITALSVAIYEWLSPFGLNPWGRQRSKNFTYGSALWVVWGLLFSHLVAFKAPKSWPNKVLINVWGAFSVIFVASYTANIAALFAGLFNTRYIHDKSLLSLRVGVVKRSAAEFYVDIANPELSAHMKNNLVHDFNEGLASLHEGTLDLLVGDTAIFDFMRGNDPGCTLRAVGSDIVYDTYAVAMPKGFPYKSKIDAAISRYLSSGHIDFLRNKWYGDLPCFRLSADIYKPQPLEIRTVAGVFLMLTLGIFLGVTILFLEHIVYKYALPSLRTKPKESFWRNRNLMFVSQKLYRFINCVELVSPHHSAKELVNNIRTGQIMGLFQKSVKRKENEQKRRRKSKAQFFEMIQEIRRVQKEEKDKHSSQDVHSETEPELKPPSSTSSVRRLSSFFLSAATSIRRRSSNLTVDYIPGNDPKEDDEGVVVVRKNSAQDSEPSRRSSSNRLDIKESFEHVRRLSSETSIREECEEEDEGSGIIILKVNDDPADLTVRSVHLGAFQSSSQKSPQSPFDSRASNKSSPGKFFPPGCFEETTDSSRGTFSRTESFTRRPTQDWKDESERSVENPNQSDESWKKCLLESPLTPPSYFEASLDHGHVGPRSQCVEHLGSPKLQRSSKSLHESQDPSRDKFLCSRSLQLVASLSPGRQMINSDHLEHLSKSDLWRLWQSSEQELRDRLRHAETQKETLQRKLSQYRRQSREMSPHHKSPKDDRPIYASSSCRQCLQKSLDMQGYHRKHSLPFTCDREDIRSGKFHASVPHSEVLGHGHDQGGACGKKQLSENGRQKRELFRQAKVANVEDIDEWERFNKLRKRRKGDRTPKGVASGLSSSSEEDSTLRHHERRRRAEHQRYRKTRRNPSLSPERILCMERRRQSERMDMHSLRKSKTWEEKSQETECHLDPTALPLFYPPRHPCSAGVISSTGINRTRSFQGHAYLSAGGLLSSPQIRSEHVSPIRSKEEDLMYHHLSNRDMSYDEFCPLKRGNPLSYSNIEYSSRKCHRCSSSASMYKGKIEKAISSPQNAAASYESDRMSEL